MEDSSPRIQNEPWSGRWSRVAKESVESELANGGMDSGRTISPKLSYNSAAHRHKLLHYPHRGRDIASR